MKYFSTKYWSEWESTDDTHSMKQDYKDYINDIRLRLPHDLQLLAQAGGDIALNDGVIENYTISVPDACVDINMSCDYDDFNGSQGQRKVMLHYKGVQVVNSLVDASGERSPHGGYGDLSFDEVELINDNLFEHRMLFETGIEIGIQFCEFSLGYTDIPYVPKPKPEIQKTPDQLLAEAAYRGDVAEMKRLVAEEASVEGKDEGGDTALVLAVFAGKEEMVSALLDGGANVDAKSDDGSSPLSTAVGYSKSGMVRLLLDRGADPNTTDVEGDPVLYTAIKDGDFEIIRLLLAADASPNLPDAAGETVLIKALNNPRIVQMLLENGADIHDKNSRGETALQIAQKKSYHRIIQMLEAAGAKE